MLIGLLGRILKVPWVEPVEHTNAYLFNTWKIGPIQKETKRDEIKWYKIWNFLGPIL
jgi:hypothetical protein